MNNDTNIAHFRDLLIARQNDIQSLAETREATAATVKLDQSSVGRLSRMDAMQQQAIALDTQQRAHMALKRISAALKRCDDGSYGYCIECDEPINTKRLEFDPTALRCITCETAHE